MAWAIPEKIQRYHCTGVMVEDMEFPGGMEERACGLWKAAESGISKCKGGQAKPMWNFHHGSLFLTLEFLRGLKQFCRISTKGQACLFSLWNF